MGSTASNWTTVTTLSEGNQYIQSLPKPRVTRNLKTNKQRSRPAPLLPAAPQYVSPFTVDSNLTAVWLDWTDSFALNGYLKEFTVTESKLRVYTGFYSYLHIPRTSQKSERQTHT